MRYLLPLILFLIIQLPAGATHIVGGELLLKHRSASTYEFTLHLYFDRVNGNPGAIENRATVHIFEKGTNRFISTFFLPMLNRTPVAYSDIACTSASLSTDKIVYSGQVTLSEAVYNHPAGYYAVSERCCRNNVINNISQPGNAGQAYYLEFPPVKVNNQPFFNSSPELFPPLSDYACLNDLFYYDFGGLDPDGDSLVYEMETPLNGNTSSMSPTGNIPRPAPYVPVTWTSGLNTTFQIPGNPTVTIDRRTGRLNLKPTLQGLYVFGIKCSEYRNQIKIGEIRRDFQLLVLNCPKNEAPKVQLKRPGVPGFYQEGEVIKVTATNNRCLNLFITDTESNTAMRVEAIPVNFSLPDQVLNIRTGIVNHNGIRDTLKTTACFPACLDSDGKTYLLDFVVSDNGCSLPKKDTIRVSFQVENVPDQGPGISTTSAFAVFRPNLNETISFDVLGIDPDNDFVNLTVSGQNFPVMAQSLLFTTSTGLGRSVGRFSWKIDCLAYAQPAYNLVFTATTISCGRPVSASTTIAIIPNFNDSPPRITTTSPTHLIKPKLGDRIVFDVLATDVNDNQIYLNMAGENFEAGSQKINFPSSIGNGSVSSRFTWDIDCQAVSLSSYIIRFTATTVVCGQTVARTTTIEIQPEYKNDKPVLTSALENKTINVILGKSFSDTIYGTDVNQNSLVITAKGEGFNLPDADMTFVPGSGKGKAKAVFTWSPACLVSVNGQYKVDFTLTETTCQPFPPEKISVVFVVQEPEPVVFRPANIFTPNNDGMNDDFTLPDLPADFCRSVFAFVKVFNRWGGLVYESRDRNFRWNGNNGTDGVFFYHVVFTDKSYRGTVTLVR